MIENKLLRLEDVAGEYFGRDKPPVFARVAN